MEVLREAVAAVTAATATSEVSILVLMEVLREATQIASPAAAAGLFQS